jgi:hypothetical protein
VLVNVSYLFTLSDLIFNVSNKVSISALLRQFHVSFCVSSPRVYIGAVGNVDV